MCHLICLSICRTKLNQIIWKASSRISLQLLHKEYLNAHFLGIATWREVDHGECIKKHVVKIRHNSQSLIGRSFKFAHSSFSKVLLLQELDTMGTSSEWLNMWPILICIYKEIFLNYAKHKDSTRFQAERTTSMEDMKFRFLQYFNLSSLEIF